MVLLEGTVKYDWKVHRRKEKRSGVATQVSRNQVWICEPLTGVKAKSLERNQNEQTHFFIILISIFVTFITALRPVDLFLGTLAFVFLKQVITWTPWHFSGPWSVRGSCVGETECLLQLLICVWAGYVCEPWRPSKATPTRRFPWTHHEEFSWVAKNSNSCLWKTPPGLIV